ncbi:MAG: hypothetical protein EBV15_10980 [Bacteroidetes bacterium]|nr:hypothetical protein [Bacteroidota bacterium]
MKNLLLFTFSLPLYLLAQVGIGTNSPNTSAKLEVSASNKGFLPPRVTLTGTTDVATISSPATGLLVFNTATAGSSPNNVTPGFYYYDGSKWQRLITQQPDATVEFSVNANPNTGGTTFSPNTPASKDYIYVSTIDNSQWTYNGTAYVTYTPPASTAWYLSGGTNDAGSNKTGTIYRTGIVGIGTSSPSDLEFLAEQLKHPASLYSIMAMWEWVIPRPMPGLISEPTPLALQTLVRDYWGSEPLAGLPIVSAQEQCGTIHLVAECWNTAMALLGIPLPVMFRKHWFQAI